MPKFVKPPWIDKQGWDEGLRRQQIGVSRYSTLGLSDGSGLNVAPNDPSVVRVVEQASQGGLRVFRATGLKGGFAMLEAKDSRGTVQAFMQIQVLAQGVDNKKRIVVDLQTQTLEAREGNVVIFKFICVTGDASHPTDPGVFHIFRKRKVHRSSKYNAQMNYAMFFTTDGKAIHQYHGVMPLSVVRTLKSGVTDWLGSHGCVRLTEEDAKALFEWAPMSTTVEVK
ncbi:MAG: L,D-transpeptidase [Myxococcota bacterium]